MTLRHGGSAAALFASLGLFLVASAASATERHFTYTYESPVLNPGDAELEPWTTFRWGRENYYNRIDQRLEFEVGLVPNLQTAFYWNFSAISADVVDEMGVEQRETELELTGISSEWKYRLSDPVADAFGSALYLEGTLGTVEAEIEAKVILDKRMGPLLLAANVVGEHEWEFEEPGETVREAALELDLAGGYFITEAMLLGLELRSVTEFERAEELESSVIYAGPVLGYAPGAWWVALTVMPQLVALKGASDDSALDLEHQERVQTRFIFGFHL